MLKAILVTSIFAFSHATAIPSRAWKTLVCYGVQFSVPPETSVKEVKHDEGVILSVFVFGANRIRLEIKIEAGGCIPPLSTVFMDNNKQIGFESVNKTGKTWRSDCVVISKTGYVICTVSYQNATQEQTEILEKVIRTIEIQS